MGGREALEVREELLTIAEISIGIAGFSGVIAAFLQRDGLHPLDRIRFVMLFALAFTTLVLAYTPIVVWHLASGSSQVWIYSSAAMVAVWFLSMASGFLFLLPEIQRDSSDNQVIPRVLLGVPSMLNLGVQCLNVSGWLWTPGFVAYLFGLFVYLYASCLMFVFVILLRPSQAAAEPSHKTDVE